jgi:hypothetical protein
MNLSQTSFRSSNTSEFKKKQLDPIKNNNNNLN